MLRNTLKISLCLLSLFVFSQAMSQDLNKRLENDKYLLVSPQHPHSGPNSSFHYLWWFGDGSYTISTLSKVHHEYDNDLSCKSSCYYGNNRYYKTYSIATEIYGNTGPPPMVFDTLKIDPMPEGTAPYRRKILVEDYSDDYVRVINYRDAVPNDIVYFLVTYGVPETGDSLSNEGAQITLDFGDFGNDFIYAGDASTDISFLPHRESYSGGFTWRVNVGGMAPGEERTMLLPFRYVGEKINESLDVRALYDYSNLLFVSGTSEDTTRMTFADSHDPNRILVSPDTTKCTVGGDLLEYDVHFQNTGIGETRFVRIDVQLDAAHDLSTLDIDASGLPSGFTSIQKIATLPDSNAYGVTDGMHAFYKVDETNMMATFQFHNLVLIGLGDTLLRKTSASKDSIEFSVRVKSDYVIGNPIVAQARIIFDGNAPVKTNKAITTCPDPLWADEDGTYNNGGSSQPWWCACWIIWILIAIILLLILWLILRRRKRKKERLQPEEKRQK